MKNTALEITHALGATSNMAQDVGAVVALQDCLTQGLTGRCEPCLIAQGRVQAARRPEAAGFIRLVEVPAHQIGNHMFNVHGIHGAHPYAIESERRQGRQPTCEFASHRCIMSAQRE
jgi:hypothetical protein